MPIREPWREGEFAASGPLGGNIRWRTEGGSDLDIGDGICRCKYRRYDAAYQFALWIVGGTTTTWGSPGSGWQFYLPGALPGDAGYIPSACSAWAYDSSAGTYTAGGATISAGGSIPLVRVVFGSTRAAADGPFTWGVDDQLVVANAVVGFDN